MKKHEKSTFFFINMPNYNCLLAFLTTILVEKCYILLIADFSEVQHADSNLGKII